VGLIFYEKNGFLLLSMVNLVADFLRFFAGEEVDGSAEGPSE